MKKSFISLTVALGCTVLTSCGGLGTLGANGGNSLGTDLLTTLATSALTGGTGADATGSLLGNIISTFASGVSTNQNTIVGTWTYTQPCVQFESESLLAKAGGTLVANKVETTLATYYQKVGIKPGSFQMAFGQDGTLQYAIGSKTGTGTYTYNATNKTITITTQLGAQMTAYVSVTGNAMGLTFDASKLLSLVSAAGTSVSSLSSISSIAGQYSGMKVGFQMQK